MNKECMTSLETDNSHSLPTLNSNNGMNALTLVSESEAEVAQSESNLDTKSTLSGSSSNIIRDFKNKGNCCSLEADNFISMSTPNLNNDGASSTPVSTEATIVQSSSDDENILLESNVKANSEDPNLKTDKSSLNVQNGDDPSYGTSEATMGQSITSLCTTIVPVKAKLEISKDFTSGDFGLKPDDSVSVLASNLQNSVSSISTIDSAVTVAQSLLSSDVENISLESNVKAINQSLETHMSAKDRDAPLSVSTETSTGQSMISLCTIIAPMETELESTKDVESEDFILKTEDPVSVPTSHLQNGDVSSSPVIDSAIIVTVAQSTSGSDIKITSSEAIVDTIKDSTSEDSVSEMGNCTSMNASDSQNVDSSSATEITSMQSTSSADSLIGEHLEAIRNIDSEASDLKINNSDTISTPDVQNGGITSISVIDSKGTIAHSTPSLDIKVTSFESNVEVIDDSKSEVSTLNIDNPASIMIQDSHNEITTSTSVSDTKVEITVAQSTSSSDTKDVSSESSSKVVEDSKKDNKRDSLKKKDAHCKKCNGLRKKLQAHGSKHYGKNYDKRDSSTSRRETKQRGDSSKESKSHKSVISGSATSSSKDEKMSNSEKDGFSICRKHSNDTGNSKVHRSDFGRSRSRGQTDSHRTGDVPTKGDKSSEKNSAKTSNSQGANEKDSSSVRHRSRSREKLDDKGRSTSNRRHSRSPKRSLRRSSKKPDDKKSSLNESHDSSTKGDKASSEHQNTESNVSRMRKRSHSPSKSSTSEHKCQRSADKSSTDKDRSADKSSTDKDRSADKSSTDKDQSAGKHSTDKESSTDKHRSDKVRSSNKGRYMDKQRSTEKESSTDKHRSYKEQSSDKGRSMDKQRCADKEHSLTRNRSKSPIRSSRRRSRSSHRNRSKSPLRSSKRRSRSPLGRRNRSRSQRRRQPRSPLALRNRSRSPLRSPRRRSRSPLALRNRSKSPRRRSRSPLSFESRFKSPLRFSRRRSRSLSSRRLSRSPIRGQSRRSRSPLTSGHNDWPGVSPSRRSPLQISHPRSPSTKGTENISTNSLFKEPFTDSFQNVGHPFPANLQFPPPPINRPSFPPKSFSASWNVPNAADNYNPNFSYPVGDPAYFSTTSAGPPVQPPYAGPLVQPPYAGPPVQPPYAGPPVQPPYTGPPVQPPYAGPPVQPPYAGPPVQPPYAGPPVHVPRYPNTPYPPPVTQPVPVIPASVSQYVSPPALPTIPVSAEMPFPLAKPDVTSAWYSNQNPNPPLVSGRSNEQTSDGSSSIVNSLFNIHQTKPLPEAELRNIFHNVSSIHHQNFDRNTRSGDVPFQCFTETSNSMENRNSSENRDIYNETLQQLRNQFSSFSVPDTVLKLALKGLFPEQVMNDTMSDRNRHSLVQSPKSIKPPLPTVNAVVEFKDNFSMLRQYEQNRLFRTESFANSNPSCSGNSKFINENLHNRGDVDFRVQSNNRNDTRNQNSGSDNQNEKRILAQRLASLLVKLGMVDVSANQLSEMLHGIGAFNRLKP